MIAKISKGGDFGGLIRYLTSGGRGDVLALDNLSSTAPEEASGEMQIAADVSRRTKSPVMHISVSYAPGEFPNDDEMRADGREVLRNLGLSANQTLMIRHRDKNHVHFHIAANRVGANGKAINDSNSYARVETTLRRIEARRGLSVTLGRNSSEPVTGARMTRQRDTPDPRQHSAPVGVREALLTAPSWNALHHDLGQHGWRLETAQKGKGRTGALLIGPEGQRIAAGKIDRAASLSKLKARLDEPGSKAAATVPGTDYGGALSPDSGYATEVGATLAKTARRTRGAHDPATHVGATGRTVGQIGEALLGAVITGHRAMSLSGFTRHRRRGASVTKSKFMGPGGLRPPQF